MPRGRAVGADIASRRKKSLCAGGMRVTFVALALNANWRGFVATMRQNTIRHTKKEKRKRGDYWDQCIFCLHFWDCPLSGEPDTVDCPEFEEEEEDEV